jgi:type II secretion system protein L
MKPVQLVFLSDDDAWRTVSVADAPARSPRCVLVVPGAHVLAREVEIVGSTPAQSRAAALATLAPDLAAPANQLICSIGTVDPGQRIALIVARAKVDEWEDAAKARGLSPDLIIPDFMLLPISQQGEAHVATRGDEIVVRTRQTAFTCQRELTERMLGALKTVTLDLDQAATHVVRSGALGGTPNLLIGAAGKAERSSGRSMRWPAAAAAAALIVATLAPWVSAWRLDDATTDLRRRGDEVARAALPEAKRIVDASAQLREAALPRERTEKALSYAITILEGLARTPGVQMSRLELRDDGLMHASLLAADLSQLQPLRDHVASLGLNSGETPGESLANSLSVDFTVTDAP